MGRPLLRIPVDAPGLQGFTGVGSWRSVVGSARPDVIEGRNITGAGQPRAAASAASVGSEPSAPVPDAAPKTYMGIAAGAKQAMESAVAAAEAEARAAGISLSGDEASEIRTGVADGILATLEDINAEMAADAAIRAQEMAEWLERAYERARLRAQLQLLQHEIAMEENHVAMLLAMQNSAERPEDISTGELDLLRRKMAALADQITAT